LRIREAADSRPPYEEWPADSPSFLWIWKEHSQGEVCAYLEQRLSEHPEEVVPLLLTYVPTAWGLESGLSHKGDFDQSGYKSVSELVSPEFIFRQLRSIYGQSLDTTDFYPPQDLPLEERIAHQFAFLHMRAAKSLAEGPDGGETDADAGG
jgi:hypothetical protein